MEKKELRKKFLDQRLAMDAVRWKELSQQICNHLLEFCMKEDHCTQVFLFYGSRNEVPVHTLAEPLWKQFELALPRVLSRLQMEFHLWLPNAKLQVNSFQIQEPSPDSKLMKADGQTIVIVPNLAMDRKGYRLGYGGGFYDWFLDTHRDALYVGVNFSEFIVANLPRDFWDRKVQWMCTEKGVEKVSE